MKGNNGFYRHQKMEDNLCNKIDRKDEYKNNRKHNLNKSNEIIFYLQEYPDNRKLSILNMTIDSIKKYGKY